LAQARLREPAGRPYVEASRAALPARFALRRTSSEPARLSGRSG
jgi:hypothetical protein